MREETRNIVKVSSVYVTTIIGAGFASGQEIVQFFSTYRRGGFYGIIFAGILFSVIGYVVLDKVYSERIQSYDEFIFPIAGRLFGWIMQTTVVLFMFSLYCIMLAGMAGIVVQATGMPFNLSIAFMSLLCMLVLLNNVKGVVALSTAATPVLIIGITGIGLYIIVFKDTKAFNIIGDIKNMIDNWFFSSLLYVSYNSIMSVTVMCNMLPYLKTEKEGKIGGLLGGVLLMFIALILNTLICMFFPEKFYGELPVLSIVQEYSALMSRLYIILLWLAMFTSAVTSGFCFADRITHSFQINQRLLNVVFCIAAIPLAGFGFSNLISLLYPIFGYIGLFLVFLILFDGVREFAVRFPKRRIK